MAMKRMIGLGVWMLLVTAFSACIREESLGFSEDGLAFRGMVEQGRTLSRAGVEDEGFSLLGSTNDMFGDIHILLEANGRSESCIYEYDNGVKGRLKAKGGENPLTWRDAEAEHDFYAWTQPVGEAGTGGVAMSQTSGEETKGTVTFGRQEDTGLNQFIVARTEDVVYGNGPYVELKFYRPVARIRLDSLTHIAVDGTRNEISTCEIVFPNLYQTAKFDVRRKLGLDEEPREVWEDDKSDWDTGLVWHNGTVPNDKGDDKDVLYVHPFAFEKDGESQEASQPGYFMLKATVGERPVEKTYRASLAGITALTELKAGQELHLILQVADGAVGGFGSYIKGWNTEGEETVTHSRPGIYSQADAEALLRYLQNGDASNIPPYFYEEEEGVKVIRLYTHADWSSLTGKLEIPSGWLLDGNGYSVGMGTGGSLSGNFIDVYTPDGEKYIVSAEEIGN